MKANDIYYPFIKPMTLSSNIAYKGAAKKRLIGFLIRGFIKKVKKRLQRELMELINNDPEDCLKNYNEMACRLYAPTRHSLLRY
jgi:hypothetical protein